MLDEKMNDRLRSTEKAVEAIAEALAVLMDRDTVDTRANAKVVFNRAVKAMRDAPAITDN